MTREEWKERLPLIEAFVNGQDIQVRCGSDWVDITCSPTFDNPVADYRIKPRPRHVWVNEYSPNLGEYAYTTQEAARAAALSSRSQPIEFVEVV